ncbi:ras-related protein Rab-22A [Histomonas meleagridis]|uniref:ras-related protein Rab-22A n=1 Tax=Histomonas meleagridis TaxID=135588 RepID=UPI00355A61B1|nr:ras-related protein Rab-22A [Histomonas meleagridis]KAH0797781.1 ras-related protein Rab-22A [Histomonas meleagridis]
MTSIEAKVVLLGATNVGKTCLVTRATSDLFDSEQASTVGASFFAKTIQTEQARVTLRIWDTAGQERFRSLAPMYYQGSQAAIIVFSLTEPESLDAAFEWYDEVRSHFEVLPLIYLVGNKSDLADERKVTNEEASTKAEKIKAFYFETSAKNGQNIDELFEDIADRVQSIDVKKDAVDIGGNENENPDKKKPCC